MKNRFDVSLNGVALTGLNEHLYIRDIAYPSPALNITVANYAGRNGGIVSNVRMDETSVEITFELHLYSTQERQKACADIVSWAKNGGKLQTSDRPDQYLQCVCTALPSVESASKWTDALKIGFTAYAVPYWQSTLPEKITISDTGTLFVPGNAEARADVTVTAAETITELHVSFGDTVISLSGINIAAGGTVIFAHDENGILSIKSGNVSLLGYRTATSSDDLTAECGRIALAVSADGEASTEYRVKGVWH